MKDSPNFYAIIPADVRYDKRLRPNEKLLYAEITALTSKTGECWASNAYFADMFSVTPQAISRWVLNLKKYGYLTVEYQYKSGSKEVDKRIIKVSTKSYEVSTKSSGGYQQKVQRYQQNVKESITYKSNTYMSNTIKYIVEYLNEKAGTHYKPTSEVTKKHIEARLNEGFTIDDFKTVIDKKVKQWKKDEKMSAYIRPQTLFGTKFEAYLNEKGKQSGYNY